MATSKGKVMEKVTIEEEKGEEASASSTTMKEEEASASSTTKKEEEASASSTTMKRPASLPAPKDEADPEKGKDEEAAKEDVSTDFGKMSQAQIAKMMEKVWESSGVKEQMDQMKKQNDILTEVNKGLQQQIQNSERFATPASYRMTPRMRGHQEEQEQPEEGWFAQEGWPDEIRSPQPQPNGQHEEGWVIPPAGEAPKTPERRRQEFENKDLLSPKESPEGMTMEQMIAMMVAVSKENDKSKDEKPARTAVETA